MKKFFTLIVLVALAITCNAQQIFPGTAGASEGTTKMYWNSFPVCGSGASRAIGITVSYSGLTDSISSHYRIYGSNLPYPHTDSVTIRDENGQDSTRRPLFPYIRPSFPFRYIGIYWKTGTAHHSTPAGTYTIYIDESSYSTTLQ